VRRWWGGMARKEPAARPPRYANLHCHGLRGVAVRHGFQAERLVVVGVAGLAELGHAHATTFFMASRAGFR